MLKHMNDDFIHRWQKSAELSCKNEHYAVVILSEHIYYLLLFKETMLIKDELIVCYMPCAMFRCQMGWTTLPLLTGTNGM